MKRLLALFLICVFSSSIVVAGSINKIVVFGDSLSDNGNLYKESMHIIPKSPPYFQGRFSNGPIWSENVGDFFLKKNNVRYDIYAVGGATSIFHKPTSKFLSPSTLSIELDDYLINTSFKDKSTTLFIFWIGANDYLFDRSSSVDKVVENISATINSLIGHGAKNFVILNIPDLTRTPREADDKDAEKLRELIDSHNKTLATQLQVIRESHADVNINLVDIYATFNDVMDNLDLYNQKYHVNISNTTEACWTGGLVWLRSQSEALIANDLQRNYTSMNASDMNGLSPELMANYIHHSPSLAEAYAVAKMHDMGLKPCANPEQYLFWDELHPTAIVHKILADIVIEKMQDMIFAQS